MRSKLLNNQNSDTTLVFLHGWACSPNDFHFQVAHLKDQYRILLIDYAAFVAEKGAVSNLFALCIDAVKQEIIHYATRQVILIGHSMGGVMAVSLASQLKNCIKGCVLIDFSVASPNETVGKYDQLIETMRSSNGAVILTEAIQTYMINHNTDNMDLMDKKTKEMVTTWQQAPEAFGKLLADACHYDTPTALSDCACPILYIASDPGFADLKVLKKLNSAIDIQQLMSGHFVMLNQADKVNVFISNFLAVHAK